MVPLNLVMKPHGFVISPLNRVKEAHDFVKRPPDQIRRPYSLDIGLLNSYYKCHGLNIHLYIDIV